jgi:hypothetical protein
MTRSSLLPFALVGLVLGILAVTLAASDIPPAPKGALTWREIPSPRDERMMPLPSRVNVRLDVLVDGIPLRIVYHAGRYYLPVPEHGLPYEIRIRNYGSRRVVAVVSVDGLSVITRKPASVRDPGYLIDPGDVILIKGFRRDGKTVSQFRFEQRSRSYAAKIGEEENIGVIGLVAIEELVERDLRLDKRVKSGVAKSMAEVGGTGTEEGPDVYSPAYRVPFLRSKNMVRFTFYYDTVDALRRAGVPVKPYRPIPFPRDR